MYSVFLVAQGEESGEKQSNFLIPNATFFVELIIFFVVLAVIWNFVVPPIRAVLQERADRVAKTTDDNHRAARAFADADAKYKGELAAARSEAGKIRDEARSEGQQILDDMRAKARREADGVQQEADAQLQAQAEQVASQVRPAIGALSFTLADRILGVGGADKSSFADQSGRG